MNKISLKWFCISILMMGFILFLLIYHTLAHSTSLINEPIQACVIARDVDLTDAIRAKFADCLGWYTDKSSSACRGFYLDSPIHNLSSPDEIRIMADRVSLYQNKRSTLLGHVEVQQDQRIVNAQTAYVYRDPKSNEIIKIEFLTDVHYLEPDKFLIAQKMTLNPQDKSGQIETALYRFNTKNHNAFFSAWGRAGLMQRFANSNYLLSKATYTTCSPQDKAWDIEAKEISIDNNKKSGVAKNVTLRLHEWPVLYLPYLSFPTTKERKSGFLLPIAGYSNVGGYDFGIPYYWNIAPNYDFTFTPHVYSRRGLMMGSEFRYLTANSIGKITGNFLPQDSAYHHFLETNTSVYPSFENKSTNRWLYHILDTTQFTPDLRLNIDAEQVSDDYYFQDFSTNLALITQRQLLRQADLTYSTEHWTFRGMAQSFQTLHPINETPVFDQYERLPQVYARGYYTNLPINSKLMLLGQYDQFNFPASIGQYFSLNNPQGPRFHINPVFSSLQERTWGFFAPSVEFVENYYQVRNNWQDFHTEYNRFIPRYSILGGMFFDRNSRLFNHDYTQTLEPSLFYLYVPYFNQNQLPIYDTANMIFNWEQLFRTNRFSGFDRIGDANQLTYALTTRWLSGAGIELGNISVGQIKYFSDRNVQLCRSENGFCEANPYEIGQLSPTYGFSPIASRALFQWSPSWRLIGNYIWNPATSGTYEGDLSVNYIPKSNTIINLGYSYLAMGDVTELNYLGGNNSLNQAVVSFSWPLNDKWNALGAYSHNISKNYSMMSLLGIQYDSCCWALRVLGGRTFKSLNGDSLPQYNNNIYLQILLKGLGSIASTDPGSVLNTYIPGYKDPFHY